MILSDLIKTILNGSNKPALEGLLREAENVPDKYQKRTLQRQDFQKLGMSLAEKLNAAQMHPAEHRPCAFYLGDGIWLHYSDACTSGNWESGYKRA